MFTLIFVITVCGCCVYSRLVVVLFVCYVCFVTLFCLVGFLCCNLLFRLLWRLCITHLFVPGLALLCGLFIFPDCCLLFSLMLTWCSFNSVGL